MSTWTPGDLDSIATVTLGAWETEADSAAALDGQVQLSECFTIVREVRGCLLQPRFDQRDKGMRIDRILVPTPKLLGRGWVGGPIGIETKRSNEKVGPALAQALDYSRSAWSDARRLDPDTQVDLCLACA